MKKETIIKNEYLDQDFEVYYNQDYIPKRVTGKRSFLHMFKNTFNNIREDELKRSINELSSILIKDIPKIIITEELIRPVIMVVPRAKVTKTYTERQKLFQKTVSFVAKKLNQDDGSYYIERVKNTTTTHLKNHRELARVALIGGTIEEVQDNIDSLDVYPGITEDTCVLNGDIQGREIILIDDIYTKNVNIDEDAINWLYQKGAKKVVFYAVGFTKRGEFNYEKILG